MAIIGDDFKNGWWKEVTTRDANYFWFPLIISVSLSVFISWFLTDMNTKAVIVIVGALIGIVFGLMALQDDDAKIIEYYWVRK